MGGIATRLRDRGGDRDRRRPVRSRRDRRGLVAARSAPDRHRCRRPPDADDRRRGRGADRPDPVTRTGASRRSPVAVRTTRHGRSAVSAATCGSSVGSRRTGSARRLRAGLEADGVAVSRGPRVRTPRRRWPSPSWTRTAPRPIGSTRRRRPPRDSTETTCWRPSPTAPTALHIGTLGLVLEPIATSLAAGVAHLDPATLLMVDPNCRPSVIADRDAYLARLTGILARADVVKVSADDLVLHRAGPPALSGARSLLDAGATLVLLTDGARAVWLVGARLRGGAAGPAGRGRRHRRERRRVRWRLPGVVGRRQGRGSRRACTTRPPSKRPRGARSRSPASPASDPAPIRRRAPRPAGRHADASPGYPDRHATTIQRFLVPVFLAMIALAALAPADPGGDRPLPDAQRRESRHRT